MHCPMKATVPYPSPHQGLIAHRGLSSLAPENTLAAMLLAKQCGFNWIECDLQITADKQLVIIHDKTIKRTSDGPPLIVNQTDFFQLAQYDYGSWHPHGSHASLLTLPVLWEAAHQHQINMNIEIKPFKNAIAIAEALSAFLKQHPCRVNLLVSCFELAPLYWLRERHPDLTIGFLNHTHELEFMESLVKFGNATYHLKLKAATDDIIDECGAYGVKILLYTVNDKEIAQHYLTRGCWAVFTDESMILKAPIIDV